MGAERMEQTSATFLAVHPDIRDCNFEGVQDAKPFKLDCPVGQGSQTLDKLMYCLNGSEPKTPCETGANR
jgi:hypothetical protein